MKCIAIREDADIQIADGLARRTNSYWREYNNAKLTGFLVCHTSRGCYRLGNVQR